MDAAARPFSDGQHHEPLHDIMHDGSSIKPAGLKPRLFFCCPKRNLPRSPAQGKAFNENAVSDISSLTSQGKKLLRVKKPSGSCILVAMTIQKGKRYLGFFSLVWSRRTLAAFPQSGTGEEEKKKRFWSERRRRICRLGASARLGLLVLALWGRCYGSPAAPACFRPARRRRPYGAVTMRPFLPQMPGEQPRTADSRHRALRMHPSPAGRSNG